MKPLCNMVGHFRLLISIMAQTRSPSSGGNVAAAAIKTLSNHLSKALMMCSVPVETDCHGKTHAQLTEKRLQAGGRTPSYRFSRRKRSTDVLSFHAQRCSHLAEPVVFISQKSDGVRDILGAARAQMLDLWLVVGRTLCDSV